MYFSLPLFGWDWSENDMIRKDTNKRHFCMATRRCFSSSEGEQCYKVAG